MQPSQPTGNVPPAPPKKRTPVWLVAVTAVIVALCGLGVIAAIVSSGDEQPAAAEPDRSAEPARQAENAPAAPAAPPEPDPDGTLSGFCDLLLFTGPNDQSEFAASVDVENTGNIGIEVEVVVSFDQLGTDDYKLTDTVEVEAGETVTVELSEYIDRTTVDRHQSGGYDCRIEGDLVDTFGTVQD